MYGQIQYDLVAWDNSLDPLIPENWANESLMILENNMVAAALVYRDFEDVVQNYGDTVNTRRPGELEAFRKTNADSVTIQDVTSTNLQVVLNQWLHVSFIIKDGERTLAFKDLVELYMQPAMLAQAQFMDKVITGQTPQFLVNSVGGVGELTSTTSKDLILDTRKIMNDRKAWVSGRNFLWSSGGETAVLKNSDFTAADKVGDGGFALREAEIGRKLGFRHYMDQNQPDLVIGTNTQATGTINAGNLTRGSTVLTVAGAGFSAANIAVGDWIRVAGDNTPLQVTALAGGPPYTTVTVTPGLRSDIVTTAVVTFLKRGAVNNSGGYAAGYAKPITVNGFAVAPQVGQFISFGTQTNLYTILKSSTTSLTLDRPLDLAVTDTLDVHLGPEANYNLAFHRNAIALVVRPIELPMQGVGAKGGRASYNGLSMRAVITYNGEKQGHLVTLDMLYGVAILDTNLGAVLIG